MNKFDLHSTYEPSDDQQQAIDALVKNIENKHKEQVLVGVTGSGKTFTMANVIARTQKPTLIMSHNKTLAAQLYQEFKEYFPNNAVSYFISYYDYYQPEAYLPQTDTYIEKETEINEEIDKLRLAATMNILTRPDSIVVASVSCIYNIGSPREYGQFVIELQIGVKVERKDLLTRLLQLQYARTSWDFKRSTFRVRGDIIDVFPAYDNKGIRIKIENDKVVSLTSIDPLTTKEIEMLPVVLIYPAKHYMTNPATYKDVFEKIKDDRDVQVAKLKKEGKLLEAQRIHTRVDHDLEMIQELGYVNGIENYSRYFDGRKVGDPPYTVFDYFKEASKDWLLCVDESHMTIPQIRGMYHGDQSRKQTLIDYGFRLPSALDNRPYTFDEFLRRLPSTIYVSATPDAWELERTEDVVEQLIRPTGLIDPQITIRPQAGQIGDLIAEIKLRTAKKERVLVTTITKQMAEDLTEYIKKENIKVEYIHSDVETLKRTNILASLRKGTFDVIIGVNLLREGLDLPEVSLVAILDADKQGFLRSRTSLIQTMGRAARHINGLVILYADKTTDAMKAAIEEVTRRRKIQLTYNKRHGITPVSIQKPIRGNLVEDDAYEIKKKQIPNLTEKQLEACTPMDKETYIKDIQKAMKQAGKDLDFELAIQLRDRITALKSSR